MHIVDVTIIGVGKLGGALALALAEKGYQIRELISQNKEKATKIADLINPRPVVLSANEWEKITGSIIFIATPESQIEIIADELARNLENLPFVFHTSGARSSKSLHRLSEEGFDVASFHPLVSFSDPIHGVKNFKDSYICIEGDSQAVSLARQIVSDLGGNPFTIEPKYKTLYHASAVTACGHLVALFSVAIKMLTNCGLEESEAKNVLLPLVKSTIGNLTSQMPAEALTGTFARGDVETLQEHLKTLKENVSQEMLEIYLQLGKKSLELADLNGLSEERIQEMLKTMEKNTQVES